MPYHGPRFVSFAASSIAGSKGALVGNEFRVKAGYITGCPDGTLRPESKITKPEVLTALVNGLKLKGGDQYHLIQHLDDAYYIELWARPAVATAIQHRLLVSYPDPRYLRPHKIATRGEVAAYLYQAMALLGQAPQINTPYLVK